MNPISLPLILLAGLLSFLSPCILPLVPIYLSYLSGSSIADDTSSNRWRVFSHALFFVGGFTLVFVILFGLPTTILASMLQQYRDWITRIGGAILVLFGLHTMGIITIPFLNVARRVDMGTGMKQGYVRSALFGVTFAAGWTPCIGPLLGTVMTLAFAEPSRALGFIFTYAMGLATPFLVTAALLARAAGWLKRLNQHMREALNFVTPFCTCNRQGRCEARHVAKEFGIPWKTIALTEEFFRVIREPRYGYGSGMNPCLDCRTLMFSRARERMEEIGAAFAFTGEVLGQRPMSQHRQAMRIIDRESGLDGRLLRPLSARLLEPTIPEKEGLVEREKLLAIRGRSRKAQMALAERYGIADYPCPAGGCRLTEPGFARRMRDLVQFQSPLPALSWGQGGGGAERRGESPPPDPGPTGRFPLGGQRLRQSGHAAAE